MYMNYIVSICKKFDKFDPYYDCHVKNFLFAIFWLKNN